MIRTAGAKEIASSLQGVPLFEGLSRRDLERVAASGKLMEFPAGRHIAEQDEDGLGFHLILEGEAEVLVDGNRKATLGPGDYFGEMSLLDGLPRSATVAATTEIRTLSIVSWVFLPLVERYPSILRKLIAKLSLRLRAAERSLRH